ncbi:MAG: TolC family protein [Candidatus Gastranaerophilales bacterium]|nr:TolC family protein [Candidatus Gastranaerophilales bacterium]
MRKLLATTLFILLLGLPAFAIQETQSQKLTIAQAIELAVNKNLNIHSSKLEIDIQKNNIKSANRLQNPAFTMFYNYGKAGEGNPQQMGAIQGIEIAKRGVRKNLEKSRLELVKETSDRDIFDVKMDVRRSYIEYLAAKTKFSVIKEQKQSLNDIFYMAKKRVDVGLAPELELLQAEMMRSKLVTNYNVAETQVKASQDAFNKALNIGFSTKYDINDEIIDSHSDFVDLMTPDPKKKIASFDEICERAMQKRYDVRIAKQQIEVAKKDLIVIKHQSIPDLELSGGYSYQPASHTQGDGYLSGAYLGGALVNIPVLYTYRPEVKNAKMKLEQAELNYKTVQNNARADLKIAYDKFVTAKINLNYYDDSMYNKSVNLMKRTKSSYQQGKTTLTNVIVMGQSDMEIKYEYIDILEQYYTSWVDFLEQVNDENIDIYSENL